jgi:hypothetical protein
LVIPDLADARTVEGVELHSVIRVTGDVFVKKGYPVNAVMVA